MLPLLVVSLLAHSTAPAATASSFVKPLFANTPSSLANKTADLLATANAKERNIVASLGAKPNATTLAATIAAYKNLTSGNAVSVVVPSVAAASSPTGTLQCLVNADGIVAGLVGANGNAICAASADTVVAIPVGDGYISGLKVAVAKRGPPFVGQLIIDVTPRGGGAPTTYSCGTGGGVPATLLSSKQKLALYNLRSGCVPAPQAAGRRRLASANTVLNLNAIKIEVATPPATADAAVPTLQLNAVPVAGAAVPALQLNSVPVAGAAVPTPATPAPPSAPAVGAATSTVAGTIDIAFTQSTSAGNPPLTGYTIACLPYGGSSVPACATSGSGVVTASVSSSATSGSISGLVGGTVYVCYVQANAAGGNVCSAASSPVTVQSAGAVVRAYIYDSSGKIFTCPVTQGVVPPLSTCTQSTGFSSSSFAYIGASSTNVFFVNHGPTVYSCPLTAGAMPATAAGCTTQNYGFIANSVTVGNGFGYVSGHGNVKSCPLTAGGDLPPVGSCTQATSSIFHGGMAVTATHAYISQDQSMSVAWCPLTNNAVPSSGSCTSSTAFNLVTTTAATSTNVYVPSGTVVYQCPTTNGAMPASSAGCTSTTGFIGVRGIATTPSGQTLVIADTDGNTVYSCPIGAGGSLPATVAGCTAAAAGGQPISVAIV